MIYGRQRAIQNTCHLPQDSNDRLLNVMIRTESRHLHEDLDFQNGYVVYVYR